MLLGEAKDPKSGKRVGSKVVFLRSAVGDEDAEILVYIKFNRGDFGDKILCYGFISIGDVINSVYPES